MLQYIVLLHVKYARLCQFVCVCHALNDFAEHDMWPATAASTQFEGLVLMLETPSSIRATTVGQYSC